MKKTFLIIFSLIILLALGVFSTQAFTYDAYNGSATGGTTGASFFDWSSYVNGSDDDDEDIWHFNGKECVEGQPAYFITSQTYKSKAECEEDNGPTPKSYPSSGSSYTPSSSWLDSWGGLTDTDSTTVNGGNSLQVQGGTDSVSGLGLDGFEIAGFDDDYVAGSNYEVSDNTLNVGEDATSGFSWQGLDTENGTKLFGTDIAHETNISGTQLWSLNQSSQPMVTTKTEVGFSGMLKNLLSGIAVDLGFKKPEVSVSPGDNNTWKYTNVNDNGDEVKPLGGTDGFNSFSVSTTEIKGTGNLTIKWDADPAIFQADKCNIMPAIKGSDGNFIIKTSEKFPLKHEKTYSLSFDENKNKGNSYVVDIGVTCVKTTGARTSKTEKITFMSGDGTPNPGEVDFTFSAKKTELQLTEGKAIANLSWTISQGDFSKCVSNEDQKNVTGWPPIKSIIEEKGADVTITSEGDYTFKITCTPQNKKLKEVTREVKITVAKEGTTPSTPTENEYEKWTKDEKNININNDCKFTKNELKVLPEAILDGKTTSITSEFDFNCGPIRATKDSSGKITRGFDARPYQYGLYIDIYNIGQGKQEPYYCPADAIEIKDKLTGSGISKTITCTVDGALKDAIEVAKKENKFIKAVTYVDYKTNEITGSHFGQEHDERKTVTTDKITIGGGDGSSPLTVTLSVDKEKINCNERVTITASVNNKSNCTLSSSNDLNQSPDSNWSGDKEINGNYKVMPTLKGSDKQDVIYTFGIKCFKDANDKVGISAKDVKVTVSKCSTDGKSEEDSLKAICDGTKEKCKNGKINWSNQVQLNFENNTYQVKNSSALNFGVDFGCDTSPFQASFARLTIEDKIIQDIRLNKGQQSRTFAISNVWEKLSETTKNNIINTFKNCDGCDTVKIKADKIWVARWNTFDEKNTLKNSGTMDCNYLGSNPPSDLTFVGHGLPKKSAGGSQDNGSVTDKIKIEASLTEAKQGDIFNIKHVGGKILDNASCYWLYSNTMASQSIKKIGTFKETIQGKTIAEFTKDGSDQEYYQIKCEIKQNGKWVYFYSNTVTISVKNNSEEEQKDNGSKSGENIPDGYGRVTFKCENCKIGEIGNCSHITVKRPGTGITGWRVYNDNIDIETEKATTIDLPQDSSLIESVELNNTGKYQIVIKNCNFCNDNDQNNKWKDVLIKNNKWQVDDYWGNMGCSGHIYANVTIKEGEKRNLGTIGFMK